MAWLQDLHNRVTGEGGGVAAHCYMATSPVLGQGWCAAPRVPKGGEHRGSGVSR